MRPLPLLRGEKLSTSSHSLFFRLIPRAIRLKSTGRRCAGRKAERRIVQARFFDSDFPSSFSLRDRSLFLLRVIDPLNGWMSQIYATTGTFWLPWMGHGVVALGHGKKRTAGWFSRFVGSREWQHKCAIVGPGSRLRERERSRRIVVRLLSTINYVLP